MSRLLIFFVICRPDFEQLSVILRFLPLLFANILVQMTLKDTMEVFIQYHLPQSQYSEDFKVLCLSLNFELIKRPDSASKFLTLGSRKKKIHVNSYCSKWDKHVGNLQLLYDIAQRMIITLNEKCRPIVKFLFNLQSRFSKIFAILVFSFFTTFFCYYGVQMTLYNVDAF